MKMMTENGHDQLTKTPRINPNPIPERVKEKGNRKINF